MKILSVITISTILLIANLNSMAQQSDLWLRNGKKIAITSYSLDSLDYYDGKISYTTLQGKNKSKYLEDIFSIVNNDGVEKILYKKNDDFGEILTPSEMKQYVIALQDVRNTKISPLIAIGGFAAGLATAFIPQPEINFGDNSIPIPLGIFIPITYIGIMGATPPNDEKIINRIPEKANNENYLLGYQNGMKKKRIRNSIIGASLGIITGFIIVSATN